MTNGRTGRTPPNLQSVHIPPLRVEEKHYARNGRIGVLVRVGSMVGQLLEEIHLGNLDAEGRTRLREALARALAEVRSVLAGELLREFDVFAPATDPRRPLSESELRIHHAQLVGWIAGVVGISDAAGPHILDTP